MILGTWNLESYPAPSTRKGTAMRQELNAHQADVWFLTELHADFYLDEHHLASCPPRAEAPHQHRKSAIASRWPLEHVTGPDHPAEGRLCLARLTIPGSDVTMLAVSTTLPWRSATPKWRAILGQHLSYAEIYEYVLDYIVKRIRDERRPGEDVIWGGDFNQGLVGRDYVGTTRGRQSLKRTFEDLGLRVPTMHQPAQIETHPAIDHIAVPAYWDGPAETQVHRPKLDGRFLSDHALYLVGPILPEASAKGA